MSDSIKIAAVVILYHPPETVVENIKSYYNFIEKVYVFDNTENDQYKNIKNDLSVLSKVEYYHDKRNKGIAQRLNEAAFLAIQDNFTWLLTMDQDTSFSNEAITSYLKCFKQYESKDRVSMFGTEYGKSAGETTAACMAENAENIITSGALLNLQLFEKIGRFDEKLFIDSVDHDYCIRSKLFNFSIIKFGNIHVHHNLGEEVYRSSIKSLFLMKKKKVIHSPLRCYYMYRNMLYLGKKFEGKDVYLANKLEKIVTGNLMNSLLYGRQPLKVIQQLILGYRDYKQGLMGKADFK